MFYLFKCSYIVLNENSYSCIKIRIISNFYKNSMEGKKQEYLVKVIVIGDSGVGKTNLITRFC